MTQHQKNLIKTNIFKAVSVANMVLLLGIFGSMAKWQQKVDDHIGDESVHMPFDKKIETFVPRMELDGKFEAITKQLDRIENKLK